MAPKITTRTRAPDPNKFPPGTKQGDYQKLLDQYMEVIHKMPTMGPTIKDEEYQKLFDKKWANSGFKPQTPENDPNSPESAVDKILANATKTKKENAKTIDDWLAGAKPQLEAAGIKADQGMQGVLRDLSAAAQGANTNEQAAINNLIASMPKGVLKAGQQQADIRSIAAGAEASPEAIAYQQQAMKTLSGLTSPEVTAKEKFLELRARTQEEQSRKAAMDAALQNLQRRGIRSGGAEIAAMTGAQQSTSQNRLMQDLGTQAGAVDRSMRAIEGLGTLSSTARQQSFNEDFSRGTAADDATKFNSKTRADYQKWKDEFKATERNALVERNKTIADASVTGTKDWYDRNKDYLSTEAGTIKDAYGRTQDQINLGQGGVGMKVGAQTQGGAQVGQALNTALGFKAQQDAIDAINKKQGGTGLFGGAIIPGIL